jgi:NAD(P)H-dependent FMN reductase
VSGRPQLHIILASTRPGRLCLPIATWFRDQAVAHEGFDIEWVDLAEWNLPFMDEPLHPRLRQYTREHTLHWSAVIERADAFVIVMPEYNHGYTAPLKNGIDYLIHEWAHKPVGFVSYGGISAGTRAVQQLKPVLSDLKMMPIVEAVYIAHVSQLMVGDVFTAPPSLARSAQLMLIELARAEELLRPLRVAARAHAHVHPAHH